MKGKLILSILGLVLCAAVIVIDRFVTPLSDAVAIAAFAVACLLILAGRVVGSRGKK